MNDTKELRVVPNVRQVRDRINAQFTRLGILGDAIINTNGLRAKASLTMITIHNYSSEPHAVWVKDPEAVVEALKECQPLDWSGQPSFPAESAWIQIEETGVVPYTLTVSDILEWDIN